MIKILAFLALLCTAACDAMAADGRSRNPPPPLRALMVTGGCCHDYANQKTILSEGISARANATWTIVHEGTDREHHVSIYTNASWAKGFDVVLHNECFGFVTNVAFVETITRAHFNGVPAVTLHCSTHSYRNSATDEWRKLLGVSSVKHGAQHAFEIVNSQPDHPVMKGFPEKWQDFPDELYQILKVWPDCVPLGKAVSTKEAEQPCIWVNTYGKARVFGTTLGHNNDTMRSEVYLDLITRGLLWACDKLDANGKPKLGYEGSGAASATRTTSPSPIASPGPVTKPGTK